MSGQSAVEQYAIPQSTFWFSPRMLIGYAVVIAAVLLVYFDVETPASEIQTDDYVTYAVGAGAFLIALAEWYQSRRQDSLERFYDRLDLSNTRLEKIIEFEYEGKDPYSSKVKDGLSVFDMWVFTELDNAEYVIDKYTHGFMSKPHADRALRTFIVRCHDNNAFKVRAQELSRNSSYQQFTIDFVHRACSAG